VSTQENLMAGKECGGKRKMRRCEKEEEQKVMGRTKSSGNRERRRRGVMVTIYKEGGELLSLVENRMASRGGMGEKNEK